MRKLMMILLVIVLLVVGVVGIGAMNQFVIDGVLTEITPQTVMAPGSMESSEMKMVLYTSEYATINFYNLDDPVAEQLDMLINNNVSCEAAKEYLLKPEEILYPLRL